ncbi:hypothetical protein BH23GEM9_BH23GEM9_09430 [soil metagenome]
MDPSDEPPIQPVAADGVSHPLDPRWVSWQRRVGLLASAFFTAALAGLTAAAVLLADLPATPVIAVATAAAAVRIALSQWWPVVAYRHASYRLSDRALEIRRGVFWRSVIDVPHSRIQHSDVSQGPLERMYGLGTLSVFTAGTRHALVRLQGLAHTRALAMREHLMRTDADDVI